MDIHSLYKSGKIEIWEDVFDETLDDKVAPDLSDIYSGEERASIYADPYEFFKRTYITKHIMNLMLDVVESLHNDKGGGVILLTSLFGGGKTHSLIAIYHALNNPESLREIDKNLWRKYSDIGKTRIVVIDGTKYTFAPTPIKPVEIDGFTIKTIWGMLAYRLGAYALIEQFDREDAPPPDAETIKEILRKSSTPIAILIDEIAYYVAELGRSDLRDYAMNVISFIDQLSRAVIRIPHAVMIISLQVEPRPETGEVVTDRQFGEYAMEIYKSVKRVGSKTVVPVIPDDIIEVLKKKIFRRIDDNIARSTRDILYNVYREYPELFGYEIDWSYQTSPGRESTVKDTYPFHPRYLDALYTFISRNRDLQKTRDAIRLTRKVVRRLILKGERCMFIMPWHIDLSSGDIRYMVLTESYKNFINIIDKVIVKEGGGYTRIIECGKPELAAKIATVLLLKTYTYETFNKPLKVFPDKKDVSLMVYDPVYFENNELTPTDIVDTLNEMNKLPHFQSEDGRYWFTPYPSVIEYVEREAERLLSESKTFLYRKLKEQARIELFKSDGSKKTSVEKGVIFNRLNTIIIGHSEELSSVAGLNDEKKYRLVILLKSSLNDKDIENIILKDPKGNRRQYINTIIVVTPKSGEMIEDVIKIVAEISAADSVLSRIKEYYQDKDMIEIQARKLKSYKDRKIGDLKTQLLNILTKIWYPDVENGEAIVKNVVTAPAETIITQVENALRQAETGPKLRDRVDFEYQLVFFLNRMFNIDLIKGDKVVEFRDIHEKFYTYTGSSIIPRSALVECILSGLYSLKIGIKRRGVVYWKSIEGENITMPNNILDNDEILPYKIAAEEFVKWLESKESEEVINGRVRKIWYEIELTDGSRARLKELREMKGWRDILMASKVYRVEKTYEESFTIDLSPRKVIGSPMERVDVKVSVSRLGRYENIVNLIVEVGIIEPSKGKPDYTANWKLNLPNEPGTYTFKVSGIGEDEARESAELEAVVRYISPPKCIEKDSLDIGDFLHYIKIDNISSYPLAETILSKVMKDKKLLSSAEIKSSDYLYIEVREGDYRIVGPIIRNLDKVSTYIKNISSLDVDITLRFDTPLKLDSSTINILSPLKKKVKFCVSSN